MATAVSIPPWLSTISNSTAITIAAGRMSDRRMIQYDLPEDSTPVDFAYAIHSDIGNHMAGSKVNKKMTSLKTKLKSGDIVDIMTKKNACPSRKWLEHAKTGIAQRHIRAWIQKNKEKST